MGCCGPAPVGHCHGVFGFDRDAGQPEVRAICAQPLFAAAHPVAGPGPGGGDLVGLRHADEHRGGGDAAVSVGLCPRAAPARGAEIGRAHV